MRSLRFAFSFLTIMPLGTVGVVDDRMIARSLALFPLVGFALGAWIGGLAWSLQSSSYIMLNSAVILAVWIISTRALHLDGLMDSFDGLLSGKERLRKLEIMKDSRVGAMGAIALVILIMLKWSGISALLDVKQFWPLMAAPAFGRSMMLLAMLLFPYARQEEGLGRSFTANAGKGTVILAWLILTAGLYLLGNAIALQIMLASLLCAAVPMYAMAYSLEGHTGDTYGALCEMSEAFFVIIAVLLPVMITGL